MARLIPKAFEFADEKLDGLALETVTELLLMCRDRSRATAKGTVIQEGYFRIEHPDGVCGGGHSASHREEKIERQKIKIAFENSGEVRKLGD